MSLWTPDGEHEVPRDRPDAGGGGGPHDTPVDGEDGELDPSTLSEEDRARLEEMATEISKARARLLQVPASMVVANHAMGLYELAAIHLGASPPKLTEARVAIDAMGGIVDALEGRLGENESVLRDALAQIRLAYVQTQAAAGEGTGPSPDS